MQEHMTLNLIGDISDSTNLLSSSYEYEEIIFIFSSSRLSKNFREWLAIVYLHLKSFFPSILVTTYFSSSHYLLCSVHWLATAGTFIHIDNLFGKLWRISWCRRASRLGWPPITEVFSVFKILLKMLSSF